jgi:hypothetical protein
MMIYAAYTVRQYSLIQVQAHSLIGQFYVVDKLAIWKVLKIEVIVEFANSKSKAFKVTAIARKCNLLRTTDYEISGR